MKCKHEWALWKVEYYDGFYKFIRDNNLEFGQYLVKVCLNCGEVKRIKLKGY